MDREREQEEMKGKAGWQQCGWISSGQREGEEGGSERGSERGKWWLCFKEQETERGHLTHMISIKGCATCR